MILTSVTTVDDSYPSVRTRGKLTKGYTDGFMIWHLAIMNAGQTIFKVETFVNMKGLIFLVNSTRPIPLKNVKRLLMKPEERVYN